MKRGEGRNAGETRILAAFEKAAGLPQDGVLDAEVFRRLTSGDDGRVLTDYTITAADLAGPFIGQVPADLTDMAKLQTVGYATPEEARTLTRALLPHRPDFIKIWGIGRGPEGAARRA